MLPKDGAQHQQLILSRTPAAGRINTTALDPWSPTWGELKAELSVPVIGAKDGTYFLRCLAERRSKTGNASSDCYALILDGDSRIDADTGEVFKGAPAPEDISRALAQHGIPHLIYSSHSNAMTAGEIEAANAAEIVKAADATVKARMKKPDAPAVVPKQFNTGGATGEAFHRYRVVIPCQYQAADLARLVGHLLGILHAEGVMLAPVSENTDHTRAWFLPRVPDQARFESFKFLTWGEGFWQAPAAPEAPVTAAPAAPVTVAAPAAAAPATAVPVVVPPAAAAPVPMAAGRRDPIAEFNAQFGTEDMIDKLLQKHGYERRGKGRWLEPGSNEAPGVSLLTDTADGRLRIACHNTDDPLHITGDDGTVKGLDAFEVFTILEHDGDVNKALGWNPAINAHNLALKQQAEVMKMFGAGDAGLPVLSIDDLYGKAEGYIKDAFTGDDGKGIKFKDVGRLHAPEFIEMLVTICTVDEMRWMTLDAYIRECFKATEANKIKKLVEGKIAQARRAAITSKAVESMKAGQRVQFAQPIEDAFLLTWGGTEKAPRQVIVEQSIAAGLMVPYLQNVLGYDAAAGVWYYFNGRQWWLLVEEDGPDPYIQELAALGAGNVGFNTHWQGGVTRLLSGSRRLLVPKWNPSYLPFRNGILDLNSRTLMETKPGNAQNWVLPYDHDPAADCPNIKAWLGVACEEDKEKQHFLLCVLAAALLGMVRDLEFFLHLLGFAGTTKGTLIRLIIALVGEGNTHTTTLTDLENDKFEKQYLMSKRLVVITDSDGYGGKVNTVKALTGKDPISFDRKNKNKGAKTHFDFHGLLVIASNEPLVFKDKTGGPERRRRTVIFNRVMTEDEKIDFEKRGGEAGLLHAELPGLVNMLLALPKDEIVSTIRKPPACIVNANLGASASNNNVAAWLLQNCKPKPGNTLLPGKREEVSVQDCNPFNGRKETRREFLNADTHAFPNYLRFCMERGLAPVSKNDFSGNVISTLMQWGIREDVRQQKHTNAGNAFVGIAIKAGHDVAEEDYFRLPQWMIG